MGLATRRSSDLLSSTISLLPRFWSNWAPDVNKSYGEKDKFRVSTVPLGALEWTLHVCKQTNSINLELADVLLQAGGTICAQSMIKILESGCDELMRLLVSARIRDCHLAWNEESFFHRAAQSMDSDTVVAMFREMHLVGADFSHVDKRWGETHKVWRIPPWPPTIIDVAALRGDITSVQVLVREYNVSFTDDTLTAAIRSKSAGLVHYLLNENVVVDCCSLHFHTTPFAEALRLQDMDLVHELRRLGCMSQIAEPFRFCAALASVSEIGDMTTVEHLLSLDRQNDYRILGYALTKAIRANQTAVAIRLLGAGASTDRMECVRVLGWEDSHAYAEQPECRATFPLTTAVENQNPVLIRTLLDHDAGVLESTGSSMLALAVVLGDRAILNDLIHAGALLEDDERPLVAAVRKEDMWCIHLLLEAGSDPNSWKDSLTTAVTNNDMDVVRLLLVNGANPANAKALLSAMDTSPTMFHVLLKHCRNRFPARCAGIGKVMDEAIERGRKEFVQDLLDSKVFAIDTEETARIHIDDVAPLAVAVAIRKDGGQDLDMVRILLDSGVNVDDVVVRERHRTSSGSLPPQETALLVAIGTKQLEMVQLLLDRGANVNLPATLGIKGTPLQKAAELGSCLIIQLLLDHDADVSAPPSERGGGTALQLAAVGGYIGVVQLLIGHGADIIAPTSKVYGRTAIEGAAEHDRFDMVTFLVGLEHPEPSECESAMRLAADNGHGAIVEMLESTLADAKTATPNEWECFCNACNIPFSKASALKRHEQTVHGSGLTRTRFGCDVCLRSFGRKDTMVRHKAAHQKIGYVPCSSCGKKYRGDYLRAHHEIACQQRQPGHS